MFRKYPSASLELHPEVAAALAENLPVVALESTLITHTLSYPDSMDVALAMESAVRMGGGVPATVAILGGQIKIGLTTSELEYLVTHDRESLERCSRRNLPIVVARRCDAATTVAGTMIIANRCGIELFATGGIGGVQRGHRYDVSADLSELGRTPVTVVSGGIQPFLDLSASREVLETNGVTVIGMNTDDIAPYFDLPSGHLVDVRVTSAEAIADVIIERRSLRLMHAALVTVPTPVEQQIEWGSFDRAVAALVSQAESVGIDGPDMTGWLVNELTAVFGVELLRANIRVLTHNAELAGQIGVVLQTKSVGSAAPRHAR